MRYIAFSTITQQSLARGTTVETALAEAIAAGGNGMTNHFVEVLDCGENADKVWIKSAVLHKARQRHASVFRGRGYDA